MAVNKEQVISEQQEQWSAYGANAQLVIDPGIDRIIAANMESCRLLGRDRHEIEGGHVSKLFAPGFPALIVFTDEVIHRGRGWCDQLMIGSCGGDFRVEVTGRACAVGDELLLHLSMQPADEMETLREHSHAQRYYLSGLGHWDRVSRVFREFERQNQLILDAVGEGIYGVDANGFTTFVNPTAERILGYRAAELAGRNMHTMVHHTHDDGSHYPVEECPIFAAFRDGTVHTVEDDIFWSKTGHRIDVEYTSTPIRDNGFIVGAVIVFRDVSQKKSDKKKLLNALDEVGKLKTQLELENAYLQEEINSEFNHHQIVGKSSAVQNLLRQIELVAPTDATVLISGESGTGKELIARAIHDNSERSGRSLIRVNCAAIPEDLFESEFFGHAKGAFTGAISDRLGRFELADGGTLFLDEVGEIPLHLQGKLLRVLQEQQFERVGEVATRDVNVRIIAATNQDLKTQVAQGRFRDDLYFRLNVFPVESVPLRYRVDDIPLLTQHFLQRVKKYAKSRSLKITLGELEKLKRYSWPGNIRELQNVIERHVILATGDSIRFDGLLVETVKEINQSSRPAVATLLTDNDIRQQECQSIHQALAQCQGKIFGAGGAAELLGLKPTTLASRIKKFRINPKKYK